MEYMSCKKCNGTRHRLIRYEVCAQVKVKALNPYSELGFYLYNCQTYYADDVHLNELGRKRFAWYIEGGLAHVWGPF